MRNLWTDPTTLAITCGKGIVPYLIQELEELGYEVLGHNDTMVGIKAKNACRDILRLNLSLRTAQRVLWPFVQDTRCRNLEDLYDLAYYAPWEQILDVNEAFFVTNVTKNDTVLDSRMPTLRLKDAIVDRMRAKCGHRPNVSGAVPVRVVADGVTLYDKPTPLRKAMSLIRAVLEDWLNEIPEETERADLLVEVDGYDLMSGSLYLPKLDLMVLKKRFERTFAARLAEGTPSAAVYLWWEDTHAKIYIDTSGNSLSRRGYRKEGWVAPMQEALAAACIMATGWDKQKPFVVPFSGSGTPAIEAAMMARNILPGMFRSDYAFMHLKGWNSIIPGEKVERLSARRRIGATPLEIWREMTAEAKRKELPSDHASLPKIVGVDWEEEAVTIAERNADAAGVGQDVKFFVDDFSDTSLPLQSGVIFMNPPYGERLEDEASLMPLYDSVNEWLRTTVPQGWEAWMITSSKPLSLRVRLQTKQILEFKNGALDCRLLGYDIGKPLTEVESTDAEPTEADAVKADEPATEAESISE